MFNGIYTPVVTPFNDKEEIDYGMMKHNLERWGTTELDGIVVLGSNGEFSYLNKEEKLNLIDFTVKNFNKEKKIIAGTYAESTKEVIQFTNEAASLGVDAALVLPPNYFKGGMKEEILQRHYIDVADKSPIPIMIYNMPGNTGINLSASLVAKLSKHENIAGIKDTSGNIVQLTEIVRDTHEDFAVFAGNAGYLLPAMIVGARGATLALANILPEECCRVVSLVKEGNIDMARELQLKLLRINSLVTSIYGVPGLKVALDMLGYKGGIPRRPLRCASDEVKMTIYQELEKINAVNLERVLV